MEAEKPAGRVETCWPIWPLLYAPEDRSKDNAITDDTTKSKDPIGKRTLDDLDQKETYPNECRVLANLAESSATVNVFVDDVLIVRVFEDHSPLSFEEIDSLYITSEVVGEEETTRSVIPTDFQAAKQAGLSYTKLKVGLKRMNAKPGDRIRLVLKAKTKTQEINSTQYLDLGTRFIGYGETSTSEFTRYRGATFGFWFPVGLVGAHFDEIDEKGLNFNVTPIALAVGTKKYIRQRYIGISLALGYSLFTSSETDSNTTTTTTDGAGNTETETTLATKAPFSVTGTTLALLFDFEGIGHLGVGYTMDWRKVANLEKDDGSKYKDPGFVLMLGLPIGILR